MLVTSVDDADYRPLCAQLDLPLRLVPERTAVDLPAVLRQAGGLRHQLKLLRLLFETGYLRFADAAFAAARELCQDADVAIGHFMALPLRAAAQLAAVPYVSVVLWPGLVPTATRPPAGLPDLGRLLNRASWAPQRWLFDQLLRDRINQLWVGWGLPPIAHVIDDVVFSDLLTLLAASPTLQPAASDWPPQFTLCGELALPATAWNMPERLRRFLDQGPPPVLFTLGSSQQLDPEAAADLLIAAARLAGGRALLQLTSRSHPIDSVDGDLYFLGAAPHAALLPRCSAVVHHGGAGTSHAVLRAGLPSLVVAFAAEQRAWAQALQRLGAALEPLSYRRTTAIQIAERLQQTLAAPAVAPAARAAAARMRQEDGVASAVQQVEQVLVDFYNPAC
jgi:sterol 3beta-glucosyltransferase/vancomycin aglycone glucosyltransferase